MSERFLREEMMLGAEAMEKLEKAHVAIFGIGGVGSWCAEALARAGVGAITLIDQDTVGESNINRQILALDSTIGMEKSAAMAARIADINPNCRVNAICGRYEAAAREQFFTEKYDYIVDAIDLVACKVDLILSAMERNIPIVSALGTGNKLDASLLRLCDISKTEGCPLARVVRKELRNLGVNHHPVVFSPEEPMEAEQFETPPPGRRSIPG
ncbi:MAG: tRNA threonylcarbamoyladenosine dehydratase, partial [Oscillospiraceae bacterium]|nr:tRNA threonylcarbamoyladenosine dehydratase [Oscillospiraceae bacterium]